MIDSSPIVYLNTHGVILLVAFMFLYEVFVARRVEIALHLLVTVVAVTVFSVILKELYLVPRPYLVDGSEPMAGLSNFSSLPSTHTAIAFGLATSVTLHQKRIGVMLFAVAAIVGVGRVLANVHYPLDIIVGILIGVLTGVIFNQIHITTRKKRS